ncbi:MAG TPA: chemotaxis protein CheX [Geobacteraceae bacterium]|nr:chemotaxis protein CheX [Geobacteraceae bacterium]
MTLNEAVIESVHLTEAEMAKYVIDATKEVFSTMVMMNVDDSFPLREPVTKFSCSITGMVGLVGTYSGVLSIHCPRPLALKITSNMLGMEVEEAGEAEEDVNDALGEIANMLGGQVKMVLSKGGMDMNISIPTIISGEEYTINSMAESDCVIIPFDTGEEKFLVSLKLKKE